MFAVTAPPIETSLRDAGRRTAGDCLFRLRNVTKPLTSPRAEPRLCAAELAKRRRRDERRVELSAHRRSRILHGPPSARRCGKSELNMPGARPEFIAAARR